MATTTENGIEVSKIVVDDVTILYARPEPDTIVVTSGEDGLALLTGTGPKLVDSGGFGRADDDVGLADRTKGSVYVDVDVDVDGMLPLVESLAGERIPPDVRDGVAAVDSLIFQTSGAGDTTSVSGFVRAP